MPINVLDLRNGTKVNSYGDKMLGDVATLGPMIRQPPCDLTLSSSNSLHVLMVLSFHPILILQKMDNKEERIGS